MIPVIKMVAIDKIQDNPYRDKELNPIEVDSEKVEGLIESIKTTGLWVGIYGRELPNGDVQISFGHSRVEAAKQLGLKEIPITVEDFTKGDLLMRMARENSDTKYTPLVMMEAIAGAVKALAEGEITLPAPDCKTRMEYIRYAPSFIPGKECAPSGGAHPYTIESIATFLGFVSKKGKVRNSVAAAFEALELMEQKVIDRKQVPNFDNLGKAMSFIKNSIKSRKKESAQTQAAIQKTTEHMAKLDAERRAAEQIEKERLADLQRKEAEAHRAEDEKEAKRYAEEQRVEAERAAERLKVFREKRAGLDTKVKEHQKRAEAAKQQDKALPTRHAAATCIGKLSMICSERNAFRGELGSLSRNKDLTQGDRERIRQGLLAVSEWFSEQSIAFRPVVKVDVLEEARQKDKRSE